MGALARVRDWLTEPERPLVALEIRTRSVGLVRLGRGGPRNALAAAAAIELPSGVLALSMSQPNVVDAVQFRQSLEVLLERTGVLAGGRAALVLPDPVARTALVPAAELRPERGASVEQMIRFRLKKSVPFEIRDARVSSVLPDAPGGQALAVAIAQPVLEGYEEACRAVGLDPGLVTLAGLALLDAGNAVPSEEDRLIVNWDDDYLSLFLSRRGEPLLVRTLVGEHAADPESAARELSNTVLYYRERLGGARLSRLLVRTAGKRGAVLGALAAAAELEPEALDPWSIVSESGAPPGAHALTAAVASLTRRVA